MIQSPCIKLCRLHNGVCIGCYRSQDEIRNWLISTDLEKEQIILESKNRMETTTLLYVKKLHKDAVIPTRGSEWSAGVDLSAIEQVVIEPGTRAIVGTGLSVAIPTETYLRIAPRSGLAAKHGIDVFAGVVDSDYRGEIKVILANHGEQPFVINKGDRIAQAILEVIKLAIVVETFDLPDTGRGANGFGSTGV